nr:hypothetical protein [Tanacetum cinerariifolium]
MQTHSSSRLVSNPSLNPNPSTNPNPKGRNRRRSKQRIEDFNLEELSPSIVTMAYKRTMAQLLHAPTEGYKDVIVVPAITADNFELKHAQIWMEKEPPRSIFTWDDLVSKFINQFFPLSKTTNLRNEITNFQQRFDESFSEAWDRFKDLLRACPHHGFSELHQLYTLYNALNSKDQDSLNFATGGNFLDKMPRECLAIIERKSKVCYSRNKPVVAKVSMNTTTSGISLDVAELKDMVKVLLLDKKNQSPAPIKDMVKVLLLAVVLILTLIVQPPMATFTVTTFKNLYLKPPQLTTTKEIPVIEQSEPFHSKSKSGKQFQPRTCLSTPGFPTSSLPALTYQAPAPQTQGVSKEDFSAYVKANDAAMRNMQTQGQNIQNQLTNLTDLITKFVNFNSASTLSSSTLPSNIITNSRSDLKAITTRSGVSYDGPQILPSTSFLPKVVEDEPEATKDTVNPTNNGSTEDPAIAPVSASKPNPKTSIPYPSRRIDERNSLIGNKEKLSKMARTPLNEHCSAVLFKKLPEKLGDPSNFLIPYDFPGMAECLALADLDASINLMPFSMWKRLSLPDLTPTYMTLELAERLISYPVGVAEDIYVKVGSFHFLADFVVVDFDANPRVTLILERLFLKTGRGLIDMFEGELTLRIGKEAITFNLNQTSRYSANYSDMMAKRIDVIDKACEEYSHKVLGFSDTISSGNPTSFYDPIVSTTSPTLTPFGNSDFLLEKVDAFLAIEDDPTSFEFYQAYLDPEGDILILEAFLNDDPSPPLSQGNYLPEVRKELKICEAKSDKS